MWNEPGKERLDKIPRLYETDDVPVKEKMIHLHFFIGDCDWFVSEFDGQDIFFGFVILNGDLEMAEWGYFGFTELKSICVGIGFEVDCEVERFWRIRSAKEIGLICKARGWHKKGENHGLYTRA
ncbi:DUF2958 domain-containing protein [Desulfobacterales bacterium HSG17]|nr:DUF2958 domain-containing protein [Desulfobacterales bacterium HSG17]